MFNLKPVLILIDVQKGLDDPYWGNRNNPEADKNIELLLEKFRIKNLSVIHIQHMSTEPHSPLRPGQIGNEFKDYATPLPGEAIFQKKVNSAFIGTNLEQYLRDNDFSTLMVS